MSERCFLLAGTFANRSVTSTVVPGLREVSVSLGDSPRREISIAPVSSSNERVIILRFAIAAILAKASPRKP